jgi:RNA-directed DNA polymerase
MDNRNVGTNGVLLQEQASKPHDAAGGIPQEARKGRRGDGRREGKGMTSNETTNAPPALASVGWAALPWRKLEQSVYRLQKRIYRASVHGEEWKVHKLQKLLQKSEAARLIAVRRVTQDNQGKNTAGIDGIQSVPPAHRLELAAQIHPRHHKRAKPVRRIWIPKPGKLEKRPLGIPTMKDRASQALAKLALEPEWEARFEPNSYGFRPGRGCHDAIEAIFNEIRSKDKYVLDADIQGCFDHIDHAALLGKLKTYPTMRRLIKGWLKAGVLEGCSFAPSEEGTPQGGVISPLLANIALDGMERETEKEFTFRGGKPALIRYADDFVILHPTLNGVKKAQKVVEAWLASIGLNLNPKKTKITHTRVTHDGNVGFDFLGFQVRQYPVGKGHSGKNAHGKPLGFKTLIRPSKGAIKQHNQEVREIVRKHQNAPQEALIGKLNPVITGWANYHRTAVAKTAFSRCDQQLYGKLRAWARRRHPNKTPGWVAGKYWAVNKSEGWTFKTQQGPVLKKHAATPIVRHVKVRGAASPYDGNLTYWAQRLKDHPMLKSRTGALLKLQHGKCSFCGLTFRDGDLLETDHIIPRTLGGDESMKNLQLMHRHCHDQKTAKDGSLRRGRGISDKDSPIEEPDAVKVACPVLKGGE